MNLHSIAVGAISAVNPQVKCKLEMSTGYVILPGGQQSPTYNTFYNVPCEIQPLTTTDLRKVDALNLQGICQAVYVNGNWEGVDRGAIKGGDKITTPAGKVWYIVQVLEHWPDWTKFAACAQTQK